MGRRLTRQPDPPRALGVIRRDGLYECSRRVSAQARQRRHDYAMAAKISPTLRLPEVPVRGCMGAAHRLGLGPRTVLDGDCEAFVHPKPKQLRE